MVARDDFRDGIREIRRLAGADVTFDHRQPAVRFSDDQVAGVNGFAFLLRGGNVNELHGLRDRNSGRHVNERAVREKRLIQRGEGVVTRQRVLAQMFFNQRGTPQERGGKIFYVHAAGNRLEPREPGREKSVHENQPVAGELREDSLVQRFAFRAVDHDFTRGFERQRGDRGDVGEAPVLVFERGEALLEETRHSHRAQRRKPGGLLRQPFKLLKFFQILGRARIHFVFGCVNHNVFAPKLSPISAP